VLKHYAFMFVTIIEFLVINNDIELSYTTQTITISNHITGMLLYQ